MNRFQIYLDYELNRRLQELAYRLGASKASLIRDGIHLLLKEKGGVAHEPLMALKKAGGRSRRRDVSERHDAYLARLKKSRAA